MSLLTPLSFHCHYLSLLYPSALKIVLHLLPSGFNFKPLSTLTHQCSPFTLAPFHVQLFSAILYSPLNICLDTSRPTFPSLTFLPSVSYNTDILFLQDRNSSVGIATRYGLDGAGIESRWGEGGRDFRHASRPGLGPTQPPI